MKNLILISVLTMTLSVTFGQSKETTDYFQLIKKADSLYRIKDYKSSANLYTSAFKSFGWKGYPNDRYNAACSWALSGIPDSAFLQLEKITKKANFADYKRITTDEDLKILHNDNRWISLLKLVYENKENEEKNYNKHLINLLDSLKTEDQKWRKYLIMYDNREVECDTITRNQICYNMIATDSMNCLFLKNIFNVYGVPNYDFAGQEGSHNFWLLIQHQDKNPQFQDSVLLKMKIEVDNKKFSAIDYAYLVDRVKINTGQLQIYGTQLQLNNDSTSYEPKPVIDIKQLNNRRKSIGLTSIEEYIVIMNKKNYGTLKRLD